MKLYDVALARRIGELAGSVDVAKLVIDLSLGRIHGENRDLLQEYAALTGGDFDPNRPAIPLLSLGQRDLSAGSAGAGGFLVATDVKTPIDILRPWSVVARAGVMVETGLVGDVTVPKVTAKSTPEWLSTEGTQATPSQPTLAQLVMSPKSVAGVIACSRQLALQANAQDFVRRELMRTIGGALDRATLNGSGANGEPTGLYNTPGVQTQSGTSLNHAGTTAMKRMAAAANVNDERVAFISTPAVRELLENRLRTGNGSRYVWDEERVADRPAFVSTDIPTATAVCGDWSNVYVGVWGDAFVLEINPFDPTGFKAGTIQGRIMLSADVGVLHASGFVLASSIT